MVAQIEIMQHLINHGWGTFESMGAAFNLNPKSGSLRQPVKRLQRSGQIIFIYNGQRNIYMPNPGILLDA